MGLCVLSGPTVRLGAHRPDCLAAKEVLRPVVLPPAPYLPPLLPSQVQSALLCTECQGNGCTLLLKLSCRSAPIAPLLFHFFFYTLGCPFLQRQWRRENERKRTANIKMERCWWQESRKTTVNVLHCEQLEAVCSSSPLSHLLFCPLLWIETHFQNNATAPSQPWLKTVIVLMQTNLVWILNILPSCLFLPVVAIS